MITYVDTGLVPRLVTGMMLVAFLSLTCGMILDTVTRGRQEQKRISYLSLTAPGAPGGKLSACLDVFMTAKMRGAA